jgi:glutathione S-transferase
MAIILYDLCGKDPEFRFSPYCWRTKMALALKRLPFETVPTPFTGISAVAGGFSKTVPVIDDDGALVQDSFDIALYLDGAYPDGPALFSGERGVAAARFFESWVFTTVHPVAMRMMVKSIHDALTEADKPYFRASREVRIGATLEAFQTGPAANAAAFQTALEPVRRTLLRHEWLGGDAPAFVDAILFGSLMWIARILGELPLAPDDPVGSWFRRSREAYEEPALTAAG